MNLVATSIPEDSTEIPAWLERRLVSPDFGRFVAELAAANPDRGREIPARQLLGDWYRTVLADGFGTVPLAMLRQLLRHPTCLLELQEAVLDEGGPYWDAVLNREPVLTAAAERGRMALDELLRNPTTEPRSAVQFYRRLLTLSTALAACLLVAVGVLSFRNNKPTEVAAISWGWAKPGGIPKEQPKPAAYLTTLAEGANEWFNQRPEDAASVAKRINEFRTGCSQLIFAQHAALSPADRDWLVERCRLWAKKLDDHLTALEAGADPLKIRGEADETVRKLTAALRERAGQVG